MHYNTSTEELAIT